MKTIVENIRKIDHLQCKFKKLLSIHMPKEFNSEDSEIEEKHEKFIYLNEENREIIEERKYEIQAKKEQINRNMRSTFKKMMKTFSKVKE